MHRHIPSDNPYAPLFSGCTVEKRTTEYSIARRGQSKYKERKSDTSDSSAGDSAIMMASEYEVQDWGEPELERAAKVQEPAAEETYEEFYNQVIRDNVTSHTEHMGHHSPTEPENSPCSASIPEVNSGDETSQSSMTSISCSSSNGTADTSSGYSDDMSVDDTEKLEYRKQEIVNRLMIQFHMVWASNRGASRDNQTSPASPHASQSNLSPSSGTIVTSARKRTFDERQHNDDENDDDDGDSRKRPRISSGKSTMAVETRKLLACHYYKRNPRKYQTMRTCVGPGWDSIPRLKQHLYRKHLEPLHCRRCFRTFAKEGELVEHSRNLEACTVQDPGQNLIEGINKDMEKQLKDKRSMYRADNDEDKWRAIYLILFPDTPLSALPSPYYDQKYASQPPSPGSAPRTDSEQFEAYLNRELPRSVRKALETAIETLVGPIEETLKNELERIVRDCQETLTRSYAERARPIAAASSRPPVGDTTSIPNETTQALSSENRESLAPVTIQPDSHPDYSVAMVPLLDTEHAASSAEPNEATLAFSPQNADGLAQFSMPTDEFQNLYAELACSIHTSDTGPSESTNYPNPLLDIDPFGNNWLSSFSESPSFQTTNIHNTEVSGVMGSTDPYLSFSFVNDFDSSDARNGETS